MRFRKLSRFVVLLSAFASGNTYAAVGSAQGTVQNMWTYVDGRVLVGDSVSAAQPAATITAS